ncbi:MAG: hypothetical protein ACE5G1_01850 [bacterium]
MIKPPAVVLNRGEANGFSVLRNLRKMGVKVVSVDSQRHNMTYYSRSVKKKICPDWESAEEAFVDFLLEFGKQLQPKAVLFPTEDTCLLAVARHRERLNNVFHLPIPETKTVEALVDKQRFYDLLQESQVAHPKTFYPADLAQVKQLAEVMDYPYILKPVFSRSFEKKFPRRCYRVDSTEMLTTLYKSFALEEEKVLIQKEVPGNERYLVYYYFDQSRRMRAACCYKKIRLNPIDYGNACLCEAVWQPEAVEMGQHFLERIEYHGLAEAEIQRDGENGCLKMIEINARSTTESRLSARCGLNLEYLAYCEAAGLPLPSMGRATQGVKWLHITKDVHAVFSRTGYLATKKLTLRQWWHSLKGKKEYAIFAWDDPIPFFVWAIQFSKPYLKRFKPALPRNFSFGLKSLFERKLRKNSMPARTAKQSVSP